MFFAACVVTVGSVAATFAWRGALVVVLGDVWGDWRVWWGGGWVQTVA